MQHSKLLKKVCGHLGNYGSNLNALSCTVKGKTPYHGLKCLPIHSDSIKFQDYTGTIPSYFLLRWLILINVGKQHSNCLWKYVGPTAIFVGVIAKSHRQTPGDWFRTDQILAIQVISCSVLFSLVSVSSVWLGYRASFHSHVFTLRLFQWCLKRICPIPQKFVRYK